MRQSFIFIFVLLTVNTTLAQRDYIFGELNFNTFGHSSLKEFQEEFAADLAEVPVRTNDNFPANFGFTIGYHIKVLNTSFFGAYNTTGGKISYSDFSGIIRLTQPLNGYTIGGIYHLDILEDTGEQSLKVGFKGSVTYSALNIQSYDEQGNIDSAEEIKLGSIDPGIGVSLIYEYPLGFIRLRATVGFDAVFGGKLLFNENREVFVENNAGKPVRTGWTGVRTGVGVAVPF